MPSTRPPAHALERTHMNLRKHIGGSITCACSTTSTPVCTPVCLSVETQECEAGLQLGPSNEGTNLELRLQQLPPAGPCLNWSRAASPGRRRQLPSSPGKKCLLMLCPLPFRLCQRRTCPVRRPFPARHNRFDDSERLEDLGIRAFGDSCGMSYCHVPHHGLSNISLITFLYSGWTHTCKHARTQIELYSKLLVTGSVCSNGMK